MNLRSYTSAELTALGTPSQALQDAMKQNPGPKRFGTQDNLTIGERRAHRIAYLETQRGEYPIPGPIPEILSESDVYIDYPTAGKQIQVRVYSPANPSEKTRSNGLPVIVLMHEGGFMLGDISDEEHNARLFASSFNCVVLNVDYLLAPENAFPNAHLSSYHVIETVCSSPKRFSNLANPKLGLILGGSSAGGNLAAMLAHNARQQKLSPPVTGVWLGVPYVFPSEKIPEKYRSMYQSGTSMVDPIINPGVNEAAFKGMLAASQVTDLHSPLLSPFSSKLYPPSSENNGSDLAPLAKAFIQAGGLDPLRDHAIIYAKALVEDWGTEVRLQVYKGYGHMFWTNWPELEESKKFWKDSVSGLGWLLGQEAKREW